MSEIRFIRDFTFEYGVIETVSPLIRRIVARNPGPFTGHGTSTYVIGHGKVALIDPGPMLDTHIAAILLALSGETIDRLLITHTHSDHSPAAAAIKQATGARTYGFGPHALGQDGQPDEGADTDFVPDEVLRDGDEIDGVGWRLTAVHTPGHTSNHLAFGLPAERVLFTGDHVMGWSTTIVSPPDGNMRAYRQSLDRLVARDDRVYLPTHGPAVPDPQPYLQSLIKHRRERSDAVLARIEAGDRTIDRLVETIYAGLAPGLRPAAARSVMAHVIELAELGRIAPDAVS